MTIAEIKKYIDKQSQKTKFSCYEELRATYYSILADIEEMLDELEPKAKWEEQEYYKGYTAHQKANICSKCGFETVEKTKYCSNCGARMNDELEENRDE